MPRLERLMLLVFLTLSLLMLGLALGKRASAQDNPFGFDSSLNAYTESPYSKLPLKSVRSVTRIEGPVAESHIVYTFIDGLKQTMEVGLNLHLPPGAILDGFGYYYGTRFIRGRIYDNDKAWTIYQAVTSRGRDPGIMDRPTQQDYHTQIYPVLPGQYLRVIVNLTQMLPTDKAGAHFTLPLQQDHEITAPADIDSAVTVSNSEPQDVMTRFAGRTSKSSRGRSCVVRLRGRWLPTKDWEVTIRPQGEGVRSACFSRLPPRGQGAYAATITAPFALRDARISIRGTAHTDLTLATAFGSVAARAPISFTGRYGHPGTALVTVHSSNHRPFTARLRLGATPIVDAQNPAAKLWADRRIAVLQDSQRRSARREVVRLSKRYTVVSKFTALLAIPREELENYRRRLAAQKVQTNTRYIGGGGGDPHITVQAPADARQVVAVFPDGSAKNLAFNPARGIWAGRFDIPFGTPEGEYRVSVIVVYGDGRRSQFLLMYHNSLTAPQADPLTALRAASGGPMDVRVRGRGIARAVAVAPWGERQDLSEDGGVWTGLLRVPADWPHGASAITVVLLDGAHNRTEVTLDLQIE